jgi:hypothetical protein
MNKSNNVESSCDNSRSQIMVELGGGDMRKSKVEYHNQVMQAASVLDSSELPCLAGRQLVQFAEILDERGLVNRSPSRRAIDQQRTTALLTRITELEKQNSLLVEENTQLRENLAEANQRDNLAAQVTANLEEVYSRQGESAFWSALKGFLDRVKFVPAPAK